MSRGYVKTWRFEEEFDLAMPDAQYKIWRLLQIRALHQNYNNLRPGDLRISYTEIQTRLIRSDGSKISNKLVKKSLEALKTMGYIKKIVQPGKAMLIRIVDWDKMQGPHEKKYEYTRKGHVLPQAVHDDPFDGIEDTPILEEAEYFRQGSTPGSTH